MATLNLGRIKPVFRGAYSGGTAYVVDDIVTHGNESFICIQAHGAGTQATSVTAYWTKLAAKGTDGTDVGTTITTQGDILFRDGSGLQRLAKGTGLQTLKMNAGATAPEWATVAAASADYVLLNTITASSQAAVSFDGFYSATYRDYKVTMSNVIPVTDNVNLYMRFRASDADLTGSTYTGFISGTEKYSSGTGRGNQGADVWNDSYLPLTGAGMTLGNTVSYGGNTGVVYIWNPLSTTHYKNTWMTYGYNSYNATNTAGGANCFGTYKAVGALSGISFYMSSGNILEGVFKLYGLK